MSNSTVVMNAIKPHLNTKCLEKIDCPKAIDAWLDSVDEYGHLEIGSRYSATGNPVTIRFTIENEKEIKEAYASDADDIPLPVYSY